MWGKRNTKGKKRRRRRREVWGEEKRELAKKTKGEEERTFGTIHQIYPNCKEDQFAPQTNSSFHSKFSHVDVGLAGWEMQLESIKVIAMWSIVSEPPLTLHTYPQIWTDKKWQKLNISPLHLPKHSWNDVSDILLYFHCQSSPPRQGDCLFLFGSVLCPESEPVSDKRTNKGTQHASLWQSGEYD